MDLRSNLARVIKAANGGANEGRILGTKPEQLSATVLTEGSDSLALQVLSGHSSRNLEIVPLEASPSDEGRTRRAPAILAMTVADAHRVKLSTKTDRPAKAAPLNRDAIFDVHLFIGDAAPNARTERRGRPSASGLATDAARPRSLQ